MMNKITAIRGFKDILPQDAWLFGQIESRARDVFACFGFREIRLPMMEKTELFRRGIGEATDIVEKEMYTFLDRDDQSVSLRPEATASVIRAYIEHSLFASEPISKLFTIGPMFRRERPQKGRFRQFNQIDVELFGEENPQADAEMIAMLMLFLEKSGLKDFALEINSLGCPSCRPRFSRALTEFLQGSEDSLCPDCRRRIHLNPLRVFDCKVESCAAVLANAPMIPDFLCGDCLGHFSAVKSILDDINIGYAVNTRMVRGLDYYTKTAFEVKVSTLGAQNAVAGGGRYNGLVQYLGGPDVPGIGFAVGVERLLACLPAPRAEVFKTDLFIAALGEKALKMAFPYAQQLRGAGLSVEMDYSDKSLKAQLKRADKLNSAYTLIFGDKEIEEKQVILRNMNTKEQHRVDLNHLLDQLKKIIKER
ncbi:MAG TPA: histidine--tRNA ligase [Smithella sp.]|nr:histidine--tRNA ligase [Smithella sp.]HRS96797.1 histidine--tRNA ligase [Smithella sp.]